jgi:uncharacterized membrane protein YkvA (DUF1232 family)
MGLAMEQLNSETAAAGGSEGEADRSAERFYDRLRTRIDEFLSTQGTGVGRAAQFLLFVPDMFILLWRLVNDPRVTGNNKMLLGTGVAYYIFPLDIIPEAIIGPIGFLDDLVFGAFILNRMLNDTDETILREHWSGRGDVLEMIRRVLAAADSLTTSRFVNRVKNIVK